MDVIEIIRRFVPSESIDQVEALGNAGGFSGAAIWRVRVRSVQDFALRRWPVGLSVERLQFIHAVQNHLVESGIWQVPTLCRTSSGASFVTRNGELWELSSWMPGQPTFHESPTLEKLGHALKLLGRVHVAADRFEPRQRPVRQFPALFDRIEMAERWDQERLGWLKKTIDSRYPTISEVARIVIDNAVRLHDRCIVTLRKIESLGIDFPLMPCLKDIWHDHVLYTDEEVTGLVDFGAVRIDSPTSDIARLLGSLVGGDQTKWKFGLAAYREERPLSDVEEVAAKGLDLANVTFSGVNWVRWLYVENRRFPDAERVRQRLFEIAERQHEAIAAIQKASTMY